MKNRSKSLLRAVLVFLLGSAPFFAGAQVNCDAIYISPNGSGILGSPAQPTTLPFALNLYLGDTTRKHFVMLEGTYNFSQTIEIPGPITLDGGYQIVGTEWVKNSAAITEMIMTPGVQFATVSGVDVGHYIGLAADGKSFFTVKDIRISVHPTGISGNTANRGRSLYGVHLTNSSNYYFTRMVVITGSASAGIDGADGSDGDNGATGGNGGPGDDDGASCGKGGDGGAGGGNALVAGPTSCGSPGVQVNAGAYREGGPGGTGGSGGADDSNGGHDVGGPGARGGTGGGGVLGGLPGTGGASGDPGSAGTGGSIGANGTQIQGFNYPPGNRPTNYAYAKFFIPGSPANQGGHGEGGSGGGGGGGGGGQSCFFCDDGSGGGGAGGGGGGQGGEGGFGGYGGGGTFGIYTYLPSGINRIYDSNLNPGPVGPGGNGGAGGAGGNGGAPGGVSSSGCGEIGCGGGAGAGGNGAGGGRGQDGANGDTKPVHGGVLNGNTLPSGAIITANQLGGCTNSEIIITTSAGNWTLNGTNAQFYPDAGPGVSLSDTNSSPASVYFTSTGNQDLIANGVNFRGFVTIRRNRPLPVMNSLPNNSCLGTPLQLGTSETGIGYEWIVYDSTPQSPLQTWTTQNPGGYLPPATGMYYIRFRVKDECCGWSVPIYDSVNIGVGPVVNLGPDRGVCGSEVLDAGAGFTGYSWSTGNSSRTQTVLFAGTYSVTVTDSLGCQDVDSVALTIYPGGLTAQAGNDQIICNGETAILGGGPAAFGGTPSYTYSWAGPGVSIPSLPNPQAAPQSDTVYVLDVTDANGCTASDTVNIFVRPAVFADAGADTMVCLCDPVNLGGAPSGSGGTPPFTYFWNPSSGLSNPVAANPTVSACNDLLLFLTVTDSSGCQAIDTVEVITMDQPAAVFYSTSVGSDLYLTDATYGNPTTWSWTFGDGNASTLQNPVHTYANSGAYEVCLTATNACGTSTFCDSVNVVIIGTEAAAFNQAFSIHPNPNNGNFLVDFGDWKNEVKEVRVTDLAGRVLFSRKTKNGQQDLQVNIDLPAGAYILTLCGRSGDLASKRVMIIGE